MGRLLICLALALAVLSYAGGVPGALASGGTDSKWQARSTAKKDLGDVVLSSARIDPKTRVISVTYVVTCKHHASGVEFNGSGVIQSLHRHGEDLLIESSGPEDSAGCVPGGFPRTEEFQGTVDDPFMIGALTTIVLPITFVTPTGVFEDTGLTVTIRLTPSGKTRRAATA